MQGVGAAVGPLALGIARDAVPREQLTRTIGILVGAAGAGAAIGYLLSGALVDHVSVSSIFWFLFAVPLVLLAGVAALVPETPGRARVPVDAAGAVLMGAGLAAGLLAISKGNAWGWTSGRVLGLIAGSAVLLAAFVLVERRIRHPLVDPAFIGRPPFANANACAFAVGFSTAVVVIVVPQLAALPAVTGYGLGYSTTRTGLLLLPMAVCSIAAAWIGGRVVDRTGPRTVMAAGAAAALAAYVSLVVAHGSAAAIAGATGALGVAVGLTVTAIASVVVRGAGLDKTSVAVAVNAIVRTTGTAAGAAAADAVITAARAVGPVPAESGYTGSFAMGAIAAGCALLASALLPGRLAPGSMASHPEEALPLGPPA